MQIQPLADGLQVFAPAKVNLFLRILGRRADGYHELETLMAAIDWFDQLTIEPDPSGELSLTCAWATPQLARISEPIPGGLDNLVLRAAWLLRNWSGTRLGARLRLLKRIPAAAGLGGGSSDAAATLVALSRLWRIDCSRAELEQLAAQLGSDVPFFLAPQGAAVCRGRGEVIEPCVLPRRLPLVIVRPATGLSTPAVYRQYRAAASEAELPQLLTALAGVATGPVAHNLLNDLQAAALSLSPDVSQIRAEMNRLPVLAHQLSGSGSAYFAICRSLEQARRVAGHFRQRGAAVVQVAQTLNGGDAANGPHLELRRI